MNEFKKIVKLTLVLICVIVCIYTLKNVDAKSEINLDVDTTQQGKYGNETLNNYSSKAFTTQQLKKEKEYIKHQKNKEKKILNSLSWKVEKSQERFKKNIKYAFRDSSEVLNKIDNQTFKWDFIIWTITIVISILIFIGTQRFYENKRRKDEVKNHN